MSSRGESREQPSVPDDPAQLSLEHVCLGVALVALVVAVGGLFVQAATDHDLLRGAYSILAALIVCGLVGFLTKLVLRRVAVLLAVLLEVRELLRQRQVSARLAREPAGAGRRAGRVARATGGVDYWTVYTDVLEDLGGLDGGPSDN